MYRPTPGVPENFAGRRDGERSWFVDAADGSAGERVQLWHLPAADAAAPSLLYLHGTFRNAYHNLPKMRALQACGFDVLAVEYRGWGESTARVPSQATIVSDARVGWDTLASRQPDPRRRVIHGHSMGGAAAVALAATLGAGACAQLVLESTFASFASLAARFGLLAATLGRLGGQRFDSRSTIDRVRAPLLFLHGTADTTVPWAEGRLLYDAAPEPKRFVSFDGGTHSTLHDDDAALYAWTMGGLARSLRPRA